MMFKEGISWVGGGDDTFGGGDNCQLIHLLMDRVVSSSLVRSMKSCFDGTMTSFCWRWWFLVEVTSGC